MSTSTSTSSSRLLVVDTGLPATWRVPGEALRRLGHRSSDVAAVVLTHAHFDHTGAAATMRAHLGYRSGSTRRTSRSRPTRIGTRTRTPGRSTPCGTPARCRSSPR
ncbi:MBL fold metallo-hydrolase [Myceligenerans pegani]|uniref:MBL fold metallo-hydrolase n=1 Tax=Myceligenerans pegani TaxID=2776917 RepID=A0ABR9N307_9MICO|nr:MBL fold metallo-hydrolase [Myceligenerans sp. TRM 65318]MBE3019764.1 MBL fold metallo-hydrolase [Myceligenerans sp. TRM 65318]